MELFPLWLIAMLVLTSAQEFPETNVVSEEDEFRLNNNASHREGKVLFGNSYDQRTGALYETLEPDIEETYDFVIVGSGSSGAVIANRLSEVGEWRILLLEVGDEPNIVSDVPPLAPLLQFTSYNWNYLMEKQANFCLGLKEERMAWPRGRVLGGTTVINYMINVRGNRLDYDRWAADGNPGWSYDDVLPYFIKAEDAHLQAQDEGYHGTGGPLSISHVPFRSPSADLFIHAAGQTGYPYVDYNGRSQLGVSLVQATMRRGLRCSSEKAYLRPLIHRYNVKILTKSRAVQLLVDKESKAVTGVKYVRNRKYHYARVAKEVILSAGAFNSPQLLMLSGIGPRKHLEELGIPVVQDLPVGEKLYDHITFLGLTFKFDKARTPHNMVNHQANLYDLGNLLELAQKGTGPVTILGGVEALAYLKTNVSTDPDNYPDIELIYIGAGMHTDRGDIYRKTFRISDEVYNALWKPLEDELAFQVLPMLLHPRSVGYLKLKSKNPYHWPRFYGNFFTDPDRQDVRTFIASIREVQRIVDRPAMRAYGVRMVSTPVPGCEGHTFDTDGYWECALRHITATLHHQVATCKMGPYTDREAVVDARLRVHGVRGVRVADTSVIPRTLSAHTSTPAYMLGERASDIIKEDWGKKG